MEKSHVGMGHKVCPVCGTKHDEVVLLDNRLKDTLTRDTFLGYTLCPTHAAMSDEYLALVEIDGDPADGGKFTGATAHVRWSVVGEIFNVPVSREHPFVFAAAGTIAKLQEMQNANQ